MARVLRMAAWGLAGTAVIAAAAAYGAAWMGERKAQRLVEVQVAPVVIREDPASIAHGKYLYESRGCMECHGAGGGGKQVIDDPGGLRVRAPDLTRANPAIAAYQPVDWVRSIRHGVAPSLRPLMVMPSEDYNRLSDEDLGALIGYLRSLPAAMGAPAEITMPWVVRALYGVGVVQDAASKIDHSLPAQPALVPEPTARYGAYVANVCLGCHGPAFRGGKIPGAPPDWPAAADLRPVPGGAMARYGEAAAFIEMMRSGKRPDGSALSRVMPFDSFGRMNDTELTALYLFLAGLPQR
ncbi:putative di-heme cytochrome C - signal peptide [Cupriavidus taiwanensis]|uniref:Di-heme cytochrome C - signal peptide n=1 Tax=Cupriavidus taiwanensis TaxID=164546 RepID=A0A976AZ65_9BURK|nr:cytochrome c [Cupriavidus taiwanensis]SOZ61113.1 putative di-heme cytochrome C - signal peptide [Cupriavidus taiwanensis]SOZ61193.1 putative di-heme cytochrome C - signal peptide [Cupriavidus taiwanensis]SOZ65362.1 putative di-heme cytochrome C - signal peptide [Cupriavidus taiwanensis]SOZ99952.1 putative di-heme cytochrome C - signal peptide [Cupriavidus taiwanensis]SPA06915.1 putative di-heme cytochrome C - signal peptide [Cupriavidus taiwanensis]